ncbi:methyl-accepting chemotaxis protein [Thiobaca trueperi]|nr:methyl-accepting chemotaxis protein [Thiobaca trueperi]
MSISRISDALDSPQFVRPSTDRSVSQASQAIKLSNRLKTKINFALMLVVTAVLIAYSVWDVLRVRADEGARLDRDVAAALDRLGAGLPKPLWDLTMTTVQDMMRGEMGQSAVLGITVLGTDGRPVTTLVRDGEIKEAGQLPELTGTYLESRELTFRDGDVTQSLGRVAVLISDQPLRQAVVQAVMRNVQIAILLNVILVLSMGFILNRMVLDPLAAILARVQDIADGEGDLSKLVESGRRDELGQLGDALNRFIGSIRQIVTEVDEVVKGLANSADDARETADGLNRQLGRQQEDLYSLTTALTQFRATTEEVARNAALASESGDQAGNRANLGLEQVREANRSNSELADTVDRASTVIAELRQNTDAISGILDVIRSIADQTNLLALNAAIEAARAGEHGRGFAVVADEVRVLSQRTQHSTSQIQETIAGLEERTAQAVRAMAEGKHKAERSVEQASGAGGAFDEIHAAIQNIVQMMAGVATAAEQQSATVAEIERNVTNIQQVHQQTLLVSAATAGSGEQLSDSVGRLRTLFGKFRL